MMVASYSSITLCFGILRTYVVYVRSSPPGTKLFLCIVSRELTEVTALAS